MSKFNAILGTKAAMKSPAMEAVFVVEVTMTRRFVWVMKLRYIWCIIRAKVVKTSP